MIINFNDSLKEPKKLRIPTVTSRRPPSDWHTLNDKHNICNLILFVMEVGMATLTSDVWEISESSRITFYEDDLVIAAK